MSSKLCTLSCILCGGTHIYPGPRLKNHLIHTHGVLQNLEYFIQASQYKNEYSRLPPLTQESSKFSNNQTTQTEQSIPPTKCIEWNPVDTFLTSTPIRSTQFHVSTPARSNSVISQIQHQSTGEVISSQCKQEASIEEATNSSVTTDTGEVSGSKSDDLPSRYGFRCVCALCSYVTSDDTTFWKHITLKHKMDFQLYKSKHGLCQFPIGSGKFKCLVCQREVKHMPGPIDKHLKFMHKMKWNQYLDWVKVRVKSESLLAVTTNARSVLKMVKNSRPMNIRDKKTKHCTQCKIMFTNRNLFLRHCQQVHKLRFKSKLGETLSFRQSSGSSDNVASNKSAHQFPTSLAMSHSLGLQVSRKSQSVSSKPRMALKTVSCRYCKKIFASVINRDRHVRLRCKGVAGDGLEVNEVQDDQPVEEVERCKKGFKCFKCGHLFSRLGNLNRHLLKKSCKQI